MSVPRLRPRRARLPRLPNRSEQVYEHSRWRRLSATLRLQHPVCQQCGNDLTVAVHHKVPIEQAPHLAFELHNLLCVCRACHDAAHRGIPPRS